MEEGHRQPQSPCWWTVVLMHHCYKKKLRHVNRQLCRPSAVFTLSLFAESRHLQQCNGGQNVNKMTLYWLCVSALMRMCVRACLRDCICMCVRVLKGQHAGLKLP